ncbi:MAG: hypothetical protein VX265_00575 [Myxococcota bacterium]|nr:hypothetical protein [Myxococcota bacterium]MEC8422453.1 hypothetical protein [Myxococcota bacterium]
MFPFFKFMIKLPEGVDSAMVLAAVENAVGAARTDVLSRDPMALTFRWGKNGYKATMEDGQLRISPWMPTWAHVLVWVMLTVVVLSSAGGALCFVPLYLPLYWLVLNKFIGPRIDGALQRYFEKVGPEQE